MASGLGGADWFEVAGRLAQAETDIGLGRIVGHRRPVAKPEVVRAPDVNSIKTEKLNLEPNAAGNQATFGPPSPPLKRHASPLFKANRGGSQGNMQTSEKKEHVELKDVAGQKQELQNAGAHSAKDSARDREEGVDEGPDSPALMDLGRADPRGEQEAIRSLKSSSNHTASKPVELPDLVQSEKFQPEGRDAESLLDWSKPSPRKRSSHTPPSERPSLQKQAASRAMLDDRPLGDAPTDDGISIWEFNQARGDAAQELERRGSLQMEEMASPRTLRQSGVQSRPSEGAQEDWVLVQPENRQVAPPSRFGVPGWNLAQTGLLSTSIGQRVASFVGEVVAASAEHEQRFAGRLRTNSWPRSEGSAELKVLNKSPSQNDATEEGVVEREVETVAESSAAPMIADGETPSEQHMPEAEVATEVAEASNADWVSRIQSATTQQLGGWLARIKTTYRGSKEDIGWLQHEPGMPPVTDGTNRFHQLLGQIVHGIHSLPDDYVYLLTPGLFSNFGQLYLYDTKKYLAKLGLSTHIAKIHSEAAVEKNALEICQYVEELNWGTGKQVVILGHSKGGIDACAALALYPERLSGKVRGIALVQSPYAGNPVCSDILREGQVADFGSRAVLQALMQHALKGELRALEDLTYEHRRAFIRSHPLPPGFPLVSFHTEASRAPTALSTITTVGHAELPLAALVAGATTSSAAQAAGLGKLPIGVPIGATLATVAGHLELRYGEKSDGLVTRRDAEVPGSVVVRPEKKLDHAWPVFGGKSAPGEPEPAHVNEALLTLLLESQFEAGQAPIVRPVRTGDPPKRWR